jgi:hypothetical protein
METGKPVELALNILCLDFDPTRVDDGIRSSQDAESAILTDFCQIVC